jgi:hypothetical protein
MFNITRKAINKCDTLMEEAYGAKNNFIAYGKAILSGAIEGYCNAAIIMYPVVLWACYYGAKEATKN